MAQYRDQAVVLRTYKLGESDRICILATLAHGKVRAVAKGVRKIKSRLGARMEPLNHVQALLWEGRNLDIVNQAEVIESFQTIRSDLVKTAQANVLLEIADKLFMEGHENEKLFVMLVRALTTMQGCNSELIVPAFMLKVLVDDGVGPDFTTCRRCESDQDLVAYSVLEAGVICGSCRRLSGESFVISPEAKDVLDLTLGGGLSGVLEQDYPKRLVGEVHHVATLAIEHHLETRLKSLTVLASV